MNLYPFLYFLIIVINFLLCWNIITALRRKPSSVFTPVDAKVIDTVVGRTGCLCATVDPAPGWHSSLVYYF